MNRNKNLKKTFNIKTNSLVPKNSKAFETTEQYSKCLTSEQNCKVEQSEKIKINNGKWTDEEHNKFVEACLKHGSNWVKIIKEIKTRSLSQIRSHAHKYLISMSSQLNISSPMSYNILNQIENNTLKSNFKNISKKIHARASMVDLNIMDKLKIDKKLSSFQSENYQIKNYFEGISNFVHNVNYQNLIKNKLFHPEISFKVKNFHSIYIINQFSQILNYNKLVIACLENLNYDILSLKFSEQLVNFLLYQNSC